MNPSCSHVVALLVLPSPSRPISPLERTALRQVVPNRATTRPQARQADVNERTAVALLLIARGGRQTHSDQFVKPPRGRFHLGSKRSIYRHRRSPSRRAVEESGLKHVAPQHLLQAHGLGSDLHRVAQVRLRPAPLVFHGNGWPQANTCGGARCTPRRRTGRPARTRRHRRFPTARAERSGAPSRGRFAGIRLGSPRPGPRGLSRGGGRPPRSACSPPTGTPGGVSAHCRSQNTKCCSAGIGSRSSSVNMATSLPAIGSSASAMPSAPGACHSTQAVRERPGAARAQLSRSRHKVWPPRRPVVFRW